MADNLLGHLVVGSLASIFASTLTLPIEMIKNNCYIAGEGLKNPKIRSLLVAQDIAMRFGVSKFFTGIDAMVGRSIVFQSARTATYLSMY
jgi:hypothetical protein